MLLALFNIFAEAASGPTVTFAVGTQANIRFAPSGSCITNFKFDNDGKYYKSNNVGVYGAAGTPDWLTTGLNSEVWIERTIDLGTLTTDGIGSGRVVLSTDRVVGVTSTSGSKLCTITVSFYDAASGGNLLATDQFILSATFNPL